MVMKRFDPETIVGYEHNTYPDMEETPEGNYVLYADHQAMVAELEADQQRVDWIEKAILSGVISSCFELDGGIHVTLERPGELPVAQRERNTFRDAIDSFIVNCPEP